jgi:hypothetical protein
MREIRHAYNFSVGKPEEKRLLGLPRLKWDELRPIDGASGSFMSLLLHWQALVSMVVDVRFQYEKRNHSGSRATTGFSARALLHKVRQVVTVLSQFIHKYWPKF